MTRKIRPHKGGRTAQKRADVTPELKATIDETLERLDMSFGDWLQRQFDVVCINCWTTMFSSAEGDMHCTHCGGDIWIRPADGKRF